MGQVLKKLDGRFDGTAVRVPIPSGSLVDLTVTLKKSADMPFVEEPAAFLKAVRGVLAKD